MCIYKKCVARGKNVASLVRPDPRFWTPRLKRKKGFTLFGGSQAPARHPLAGRPPPYFLGQAGAVPCRAVLPPHDRTGGRGRKKQPKPTRAGDRKKSLAAAPTLGEARSSLALLRSVLLLLVRSPCLPLRDATPSGVIRM